jgi:hypothetical protein
MNPLRPLLLASFALLATAVALRAQPAAPTGLNATLRAPNAGYTSSSTVILTWTDNSANELGFAIERRLGTGAYVDIAAVPPNVTTYTDHTNDPAKSFTYRVRSFNGTVFAPAYSTTYSNTATITTGAQVDQVPAFPGATGYGSATRHGRGGTVLHVTNPADYIPVTEPEIPGTLRWALTRTFPRIIVFDIAGVIRLRAPLTLLAAHSNFYLAGQSAPGTGVVVVGAAVTLGEAFTVGTGPAHEVSNFLIRHLRLRRGDYRYANNAGSIDSLTLRQVRNGVVDHASLSWGADGCADLNSFADLTLSYCLIGPGNNESIHDANDDWWHNKNQLLGNNNLPASAAQRLSLIRNVYYNSDDRAPLFGGHGGHADMFNNVIVGYRQATEFSGRVDASPGWQANVINNHYDDFATSAAENLGAIAIREQSNGVGLSTRYFIRGNYHPAFAPAASDAQQGALFWDSYTTIAGNSWTDFATPREIRYGSYPFAPVVVTAATAKTDVLDNAGATIPKRDFVDADYFERMNARVWAFDIDTWAPLYRATATPVIDLRSPDSQLLTTGTGYLTRSFGTSRTIGADLDGDGAPDATTGFDADGDGIRDAWETATANINQYKNLSGVNASLSVGVNNSGWTRRDGTGYTALEDYLNGVNAASNGLTRGTDETIPARTLPDPGNALFDGSFEDGIAGWTSLKTGIREYALGRSGKAVEVGLRDFGASHGKSYLRQRIIDDLVRTANTNGAAANQTYYAEAWVRLPTGTGNARLQLRFIDDKNGNGLYDALAGEDITVEFDSKAVDATGWTKLSGTQTFGWTKLLKTGNAMPWGAYFVVDVDGTTVPTYYVDDCVLYNTARPPGGTPSTITRELESTALTPAYGNTDGGNPNNSVANAGAASAGQYHLITPTGTWVGDYVEYTVNVPVTGSYALKVAYQRGPARGRWQLAVDGSTANNGGTIPVVDAYNSSNSFVDTGTSLGERTLSAGNHTFRFTCTGKAGAATDYRLALDKLTLTPP